MPPWRAGQEPTWGGAWPGTSPPCCPRQGQRAVPCLAFDSWPCLVTSEVSLNDYDFLLEDTEASAAKEASEVPLQSNNGPALPLVPSSLQKLPSLLLQKDLVKGNSCWPTRKAASFSRSWSIIKAAGLSLYSLEGPLLRKLHCLNWGGQEVQVQVTEMDAFVEVRESQTDEG